MSAISALTLQKICMFSQCSNSNYLILILFIGTPSPMKGHRKGMTDVGVISIHELREIRNKTVKG